MYKILHLPTATFLYHYTSNTGDLFTEYEYYTYYKEQGERTKDFGINTFESLEIVERYIKHWCDPDENEDTFYWEPNYKTPLKEEHLEIIKVDDEM